MGLLIVFLAVSSTVVYAATNITWISTDTIWDLAGSPYIINPTRDWVTIHDDATLTIEPGVEVKFNQYKGLRVGNDDTYSEGTLRALGTSESHVTFTANTGSPSAGYWGDINFTNYAVDSELVPEGTYGGSLLDYCDILYGTGSVYCVSSSPRIDHCTISYSLYDGVDAHYYASPTVSECIISNNDWSGVCASYDASPTVSNCTISDNGGHGVHASYYASPTVSNCTLENNTYGFNGHNSTPTLSGNTIQNNN